MPVPFRALRGPSWIGSWPCLGLRGPRPCEFGQSRFRWDVGFRTFSVSIVLAAALLVSGCRSNRQRLPQPAALPGAPVRTWAVRIERPGLPQLHRVSDHLFRSAQPTAEGFRQLAAMGVKTVVHLRAFYNDRDRLAGTGLAYEEISMPPWNVEEEDAVRFLQLVTDGSRGPYLVHCTYGADRTGTLCAVYRIAVEGWTKDEAIAEMTQGGFGFHPFWDNLVKFIRKLDVEQLKRRAFPARAREAR